MVANNECGNSIDIRILSKVQWNDNNVTKAGVTVIYRNVSKTSLVHEFEPSLRRFPSESSLEMMIPEAFCKMSSKLSREP